MSERIRPVGYPWGTNATRHRHDATYSETVLTALGEVIQTELDRLGRGVRVLDPMAGIGKIHRLASKAVVTYGVEVEPEWAAAHKRTRLGDALHMPRAWGGRFDLTITSPDYGNRMADDFESRDNGFARKGYRWSLGRKLSPASIVSAWGPEYRSSHAALLREMIRVTRPAFTGGDHLGGLIVINASDHVRDGELIEVVEWYRQALDELDCTIEQDIPVSTSRMGYGANRTLRAKVERILVARVP